jgi:outer membrane protein OmpA-like peptidoglycan-associated protein
MKTLLVLFPLSFLVVPRAGVAAPVPEQSVPIVNSKISRTIETVNYRAKSTTAVDFRGTAILAEAKGEAKVETKSSGVLIEATFEHLGPPSRFGPAFLTYVLWAISPEGRPDNLGELTLNGSKSKIQATTTFQTFGMMVTAEPYFAVTTPSGYVVLENVPGKDTKGAIEPATAKYELLRGDEFKASDLPPLAEAPGDPLELKQARNAQRIARWRGAEHYAPDSWAKAEASLIRAEDYQTRKQHKAVPTAAREAVQAFADAITITLRRAQEEQSAERRAEAAAREEQARSERQRAELNQAQAERQRAEAEARAAREAEARAQAEREQSAVREQQESERQQALAAQQQATAAQQQAAEAQQQAQQARQTAEQQRLSAERARQDQQQLRAELLEQFNRILETRETTRGLIVSLGDVLFATAKYDLQPQARERLAKLAGIVMAHPGLHLAVEGYTDNVGSELFNQKLSEERADSVRAYLIAQGLDPNSVSTTGYGESHPVADNATAQGRERNRRVEIVVSGQIIGAPIGVAPTGGQR